MSSSNPYSASGAYDPLTENLNAPGDLPLASQMQRFLTSIIDNILLYFINTGVGVGVGLMAAIVGGGATFTTGALHRSNHRYFDRIVGRAGLLLHFGNDYRHDAWKVDHGNKGCHGNRRSSFVWAMPRSFGMSIYSV